MHHRAAIGHPGWRSRSRVADAVRSADPGRIGHADVASIGDPDPDGNTDADRDADCYGTIVHLRLELRRQQHHGLRAKPERNDQ
jgi:hypothetical protein